MSNNIRKIILVVVPSMEDAYHRLQDFVEVAIPVGITSIAAVLVQRGYDVSIIDADAAAIRFDDLIEKIASQRPYCVGSTCMTATMGIADRFYNKLKQRLPQVLTVVGGPHVSALPMQTLQDCPGIDIVVKGEGEETAADLFDALEKNRPLSTVKGIAYRYKGEVVENQERPLIEDLGILPLPAYHLLDYNLYRSYGWNAWVNGYRAPIGTMFTGRGCLGKCNFCAAHTVFKNRIRYFPFKRICEELDLLVSTYNIRVLYFEDDTFTANRRVVNEVCDYIIEKDYHKRLEIMVSARVDTIHFPTLLKMRESGIRWIFFGVESGNQSILDAMHKNITVSQIREAFKKSNDAGLFVGGNYMIGNIGETYETAMDTIDLACELKQDYASFALAIPLPGTKLYSYCIEHNITLPPWAGFGSMNSHPIPINESLDSKRLMGLRRQAINRFFRRPGYIFRSLRRFNKLALLKDFFRMYFLLKKEIKEERF